MVTKNYKKKKDDGGFVLVATLVLIMTFSLSSAAFTDMMMREVGASKLGQDSTKAFYMAEAGINRKVSELRNADPGDIGLTSLNGQGEYEVEVGATTITSEGYSPSKANYEAGHGSKRTVEVEVSTPTPSNFYESAMLAAGTIDLIGGNYKVIGDPTASPPIPAIQYSGVLNEGGGTITGAKVQVAWANPLPRLNFEELKTVAESQIKANGQDNVYTAANIAAGKAFPARFWFTENDGIDNDNDGTIDETDGSEKGDTPNTVYVETDLTLNGNISIGGFYVVVGNLINSTTTINGKGSIDGCVYTLGQYRSNGGGNGFGVIGGIWAGSVRMNGNSKVTFNSEYMTAVDDMDIGLQLQITSWQEMPGY